jgi:hypothetical protein
MWKNIVERGRPLITIWRVCALHAAYVRLQTHTQNMQYLLLFHCNNGCTKARQCYVIGTMSVLFTMYGCTEKVPADCLYGQRKVKYFDSFTKVVCSYMCGVSVRNLTYRIQLSGKLLVAPALLCTLTADSATADRREQSEPASLLLQPRRKKMDDDTDDFWHKYMQVRLL